MRISKRELLVFLLPMSLLAQGKGKSKGKGKAADIGFGADSRVILDYFHPTGSGLPPGLAKRGGDLPPGLEKQLRRKGRLPPGLQKKLVAFPVDLEARLGPLCGGCRRATLGTWALLIQDATNVILDIIDLAKR